MMIRAKYVRIRQSLPSSVAERWKWQYCEDGKWKPTATHDSKAVYDQLIGLSESPTKEQVASIIGNESWTQVMCDGCGESRDHLAEIGEYGRKAYCETCLREAIVILESA